MKNQTPRGCRKSVASEIKHMKREVRAAAREMKHARKNLALARRQGKSWLKKCLRRAAKAAY